MKTFDYGQGVRLLCPLTVSGVATDPATLSLVVRTPAGVDTTYTLAGGQIAKDATGQYHYDLIANQAGFWLYAWTATSPQAAYKGQFFVALPVP